MSDNIRTMAANVLAPILRHEGTLHTTLPRALVYCPEREQPLLKQLCYGVMRDLPRLNTLAKGLLQRPFKARDFDVRALVLLGLYQLRSMRIPEHAAVHETVEASHDLGKSWAASLLNGLLRRYQREEEAREANLLTTSEGQYNHPDWFIEKLRHNWPEQFEAILEANNDTAPPMTLRVNQRCVSRDDYLKHLSTAGIVAQATPYSVDGIVLSTACDVEKLPHFAQGWVSVQDEAAQLSAQLLDLKPKQRFLDACSAPGGKLCHALELQPDLACADALELERHRIGRIEDNLSRLQLDADVFQGDASNLDWWDEQSYDRILVDAPCSATGVIRRNPDIKYLRKGEDIKGQSDLQLAILQNLWHCLRPNGRLVYATCSIFPQENERLIKRFLAAQPDAVHQPIDADWGEERSFGRQLFPRVQSHDGFYYAVLTKTGI
ncbi:MAG: 16S rRNA (cytosine(967)-C(5))-methyltransferase RsmB [Pontibacterium sp.]